MCLHAVSFQSGFTPLHSTLTGLLDNRYDLNIDNGSTNAILFIDLKKAFDTIDHEIILRKLGLFGFKGRTFFSSLRKTAATRGG